MNQEQITEHPLATGNWKVVGKEGGRFVIRNGDKVRTVRDTGLMALKEAGRLEVPSSSGVDDPPTWKEHFNIKQVVQTWEAKRRRQQIVSAAMEDEC